MLGRRILVRVKAYVSGLGLRVKAGKGPWPGRPGQGPPLVPGPLPHPPLPSPNAHLPGTPFPPRAAPRRGGLGKRAVEGSPHPKHRCFSPHACSSPPFLPPSSWRERRGRGMVGGEVGLGVGGGGGGRGAKAGLRGSRGKDDWGSRLMMLLRLCDTASPMILAHNTASAVSARCLASSESERARMA